MDNGSDILAARNWLAEHCHQSHVRTVLARSLLLADALERAGWPLHTVDGDELFELFTDEKIADALHHHLVQSTL